MCRVPNTGAAEHERLRLIKKLEANLRSLERIPAERRNAELADIRTETCLAMIGDLRGGLPLVEDHRRLPAAQPLDR
jgi:hypothetical protein